MKIRFALPASIFMVFVLSVAAYGMTNNNTGGATSKVSVAEHLVDDSQPEIKSTIEISEAGSEIMSQSGFEDVLPTLTTSTKDSGVGKWLEARTAREAVFAKAKPRETAAEATPVYNEGGGWCDWCGCWMKHGCDPNGNCNIGHAQVCGPDSCVLHPQGPCYNSPDQPSGGHG